VPNITIGPVVVKALRPHSNKTFDCHLMISPVDVYVPEFAAAGADIITFHPEAGPHAHRTVQLIKSLGKKAGISLNPGTPVDIVDYLLPNVDLVLVMSVNPGFGGQKFIPGTLDKLREARAIIDASGRDIRLEIDGGVNVNNIREIAAAGADTFVAGSAIFNAPNYQEVIDKMRSELALARP
jgi:ribulose-phosphate 3-epimerase